MVANKSLTGNQQSQLTWDRRIPPLESGNRLSWHEFERRYDAMPHLKKADPGTNLNGATTQCRT
jgi:hypothetical protein